MLFLAASYCERSYSGVLAGARGDPGWWHKQGRRRSGSWPGLEHLALIVVSGLANEKHRGRARDLGFEGYFLKPSNLSGLSSTLERVVQRSAADKWRNSC